MFGYVSQKEFDAQCSARDRAEAHAESWRQFAEEMARSRDLAFTLLKDERQAHAQQMREARAAHADQVSQLLTHLAPPPAPAAGPGPEGELRRPTAAEIEAEPASTKREMFVRSVRANQARIREEAENQDKAFKERDAVLNDEERAAMRPDFDSTLGIHSNPMERENGETHADN